MEQQDFLAALERALAMDKGTLELTQTLEDLENWDSMAVLEFQAIADEEYGLQVDPTAIDSMKTIGDLWDQVAAHIKK